MRYCCEVLWLRLCCVVFVYRGEVLWYWGSVVRYCCEVLGYCCEVVWYWGSVVSIEVLGLCCEVLWYRVIAVRYWGEVLG